MNRIPVVRPIQSIVLPKYSVQNLDNGLRLILVNGGTPEVFKLETIFHAGRFYEQQELVSTATVRMMKEGAKGYSAENIAEIIDFHGASLSTSGSFDYTGLTLYGLNQHFEKLLPLYRSILTQPTFPEHELKDYIQERKQLLKVDLTKTDVVAYRKVTEAMFGSNHPYGYNSTDILYDALNVPALQQHFAQHFVTGNCTVILSGRINDAMIQFLEQELFPALSVGTSTAKEYQAAPFPEHKIHIAKENAVQTAIRIGLRVFNRSHPDFFGLYVLNMVLGDYFGSRLMKNIREDKGYTYSIYSMLDMMKKGGSLLISTETANEYAKNTLYEIYKELDILQNELIPQKELQMARNYTLGSMFNTLNGPFNTSKVVKDLYMNDLDGKHFNNLIHAIQHITSEELRNLAQKYLNKENMYEVTVGQL